jgi:2-iminobutanoate/2-iminopropanoate deaminase
MCRGGVIRSILERKHIEEYPMKEISTPNAPKPAGHYAQGMVHQGFVFVSGQLPIDPTTGDKCLGSIEEQTRLVLKNVEAILVAANSGKDLVLKATVYMSNIEQWERVNAVYQEFFGGYRPARAVVPTRDLHYGLKVEIEVIAAVREA